MSLYIGEMPVDADMLDILEKLCILDGRNGSMFVFNDKLRRTLSSYHYVKTDIKGWVTGTDYLRAAIPNIRTAFFECLKKGEH